MVSYHIQTQYYIMPSKSLNYYKLIFCLNRIRQKIEYFLWNIFIGNITNNLKIITTSNINKRIVDIEDDHEPYIIESMIRFFQEDTFNMSKIHRWYKNISKNNTIISEKVGLYSKEKLEKNVNNLFLTSHGIYSLWGPSYKTIKNKKKKIVFGPNFYQKNAISFFNNIHQVTFNEDSLNKFLDTELDKTKTLKVDSYIENRVNYKEKDTKIYIKNSIKDDYKLKRRSSYPGKLFIVYPNIVWDGNVAARNNLFTNISEWLIKLIHHFKEHNDNSLIIRFHPTESTWFKGTKNF